MAQGGYRKPEKPAPVSGPGRFSRRTDGGPTQPVRAMTGGDYGDNADMANLQASAPMEASGRSYPVPAPKPARAPAPAGGNGPGVTPFTAPSANPAEPVTAGADAGPGPGSDVLPQQAPTSLEYLRGYLPVLTYIANQPNASNELRDFVRTVRGVLA